MTFEAKPGPTYRITCACGWKGTRKAGQCECYSDWSPYCWPTSPGPGCPSGVVWPCPRCGAKPRAEVAA